MATLTLPCHKNSIFTLPQRNHYSHPQNQRQHHKSKQHQPVTHPTTPPSPHSCKPWRGTAPTYPNAPYLWKVDKHPLGYTILTAHILRCRNEEQLSWYTIAEPPIGPETPSDFLNILWGWGNTWLWDDLKFVRRVRFASRGNIRRHTFGGNG